MADATITMPPSIPGPSRRGLMARAGLVGAAAALGTGLLDVGEDRRGDSADAANPLRATFGPTTAEKKFVVSDLDILTFALNTEYFEAEFYLRAVNGTGLAAALTTGGQGYGKSPYKAVTPGVVNAYASGTSNITTGATTPVPFTEPAIQQFAQELAADEQEHVTFLRTALGKHAPARPACDLAGAFTQFMRSAGVIGITDIFDPFASQRNFLLAAYLINDIGPTAYIGAAPYLNSPTYIEASAGILGTEAYHAGETRTLVFATAQEQDDQPLLAQAGAIATLRNNTAALSGAAAITDQGVVDANDQANITPTDANGIAFARPFSAILSLFYLNTTATLTPPAAGFTPSGFNGRIR
jgi:hypothetical protein